MPHILNLNFKFWNCVQVKDFVLIVYAYPYCTHNSRCNVTPHHASSSYTEEEMKMTIALVGIVIFTHRFNSLKCTVIPVFLSIDQIRWSSFTGSHHFFPHHFSYFYSNAIKFFYKCSCAWPSIWSWRRISGNLWQRGTGNQSLSSKTESSDQTGLTKKVVHLKRRIFFSENFSVGLNRFIQFRTKISGNFGWMVSTQKLTPLGCDLF